MIEREVLEGTWEAILALNSAQLAGRRVKVYFEPDVLEVALPAPLPNEKALAALRQIAKMQEGKRETDGSQTDRFIREGRAGGMYGLEPTE